MASGRRAWLSYELAALLLVIAGVIGVYWSTVSGIVSLWSYDGFKHCALVPAVSLVVLWQNRAALDRREMRGSWVGCVLLAASIWVWLVARQTLIQVAEQLAVLSILHSAVLALFGWATYKRCSFALGYLLLAIPIGLESIPLLMHATARVVEVGLRLMGVPVLQEGMYFTLPGGQFEIASACSGFRYLNAGLALAVLIAYLFLAGTAKRIAFVAAAAVAALLMNGIRAMLVIAIASATQMRLMAGTDHVWFGWGLFVIYVGGLCWWAVRFGSASRREQPSR